MGSAPALHVFKCTQCEKCCTDLKGRAAGVGGRRDFKALERPGVYSLATTGGIQLWAWEREKLSAIAKARGLPLRTAPAMVFADAKLGAVVLVYEVLNRSCPFFKTPVCTIYEDRPLVCGAFPVLPGGRDMGFTAFCPEVVVPAANDDATATLVAAYGDTARHALKIRDVTARVSSLLGFMVASGGLSPVKDLSEKAVDAMVERRRIDLHMAMGACGMFSKTDVEDQVKIFSLETVPPGDAAPRLRPPSH
ncbi:MAG: YkgJ family cysteine cluster protein [Euryarchaeota archaeon]|nr:YkgJ family cysteine cluster protein [Euryarchaeota archaeon]